MQLREVMTKEFKTIDRNAAVREAAEIMRDLDVGVLPVVEDGDVIGTLTDRDITVRAIAAGMAPDASVSSIMSTGIVFARETDDIEEAAKTMEDKQVRRLLVLDDANKCVGIVSLGDISVRTGDQKLSGEALEGVSQGV
jgi:predicted transcriptional regulator